MPKPSPIQRALAKFGDSPTKMAAALGGGVLRQHVEHWRGLSVRVPAEHCRKIQELTGVKCWDLRPDDWHRIWPDLIGAKGAPKVPVAAASKGAASTDLPHAAAAKRAAKPRAEHSNPHQER